MNIQEEFEKWAKQYYKQDRLHKTLNGINYKIEKYQGAFEGWNACAELMQAEIDKLKNRVRDADNCRDQAKRELEKQDKEIEALRCFIKSILYLPVNDNRFNNQCIELAEKYGLIDNNAHPTQLLTGK